MTMQDLAEVVAKREAGKRQLDIVQIKEILAILSDLCAEDVTIASLIIRNGREREILKSVGLM